MNSSEIHCPLCQSADCAFTLAGRDRLHGVVGSWDLYRCGQCQVGFLHPMPTMDEIKSFYPEDYYAYTPPSLPSKPTKALKRLEYRIRQCRSDAYAQSLGYPPKMAHGWLMRWLVRIFPPNTDIPPYTDKGILLDIGCGQAST